MTDARDRGDGVRPADACLIDVDGTLYEEGRAIPGAAEALAALREAGVPFRIATNITRRPRVSLVERLAGLGIEISADECLTAPMAAVEDLRARGVRRVQLLLYPATWAEFEGFEIVDEEPEAVVVGDLGQGFTYDVLNRAFRALHAGAELLAIHRNPYWRTSEGLCLDAGAYVAALELASGQTARLVGKPSATFFAAAAEQLGVAPGRIAMVGDDPEADVRGARRAGLRAVAVRTGKLRDAPPERAAEADAVLGSVAELPRWLGL